MIFLTVGLVYGGKRHFQQYFSYIVAASYWWRKQEYPEKTTDLLQVTEKQRESRVDS